ADVDRRRTVVVGDALRVDELPDPRGLDLAQADVGAGDGGDAPGGAPAVAVAHLQRPEILGRCRCSTATAGASPGASPPSPAPTSACARSSPRGSGSSSTRRASPTTTVRRR